jgi:hypothetical protein
VLLSSSVSSTQPPQQRQQPTSTASSTVAQVPQSLSLAPASVVEPTLLAVSPRLAPGIQRSCWCMADFVIQKKLYEGYASTICKVSCLEGDYAQRVRVLDTCVHVPCYMWLHKVCASIICNVCV